MSKLEITALIITGIELLGIWHLNKKLREHVERMEDYIRFGM